jgi:hypothetical protein
MNLQNSESSIQPVDDIRAGYKIEIFFGPDRSAMKDFYAFVSIFESGKFFHGGGDGNMYYCLDRRAIHKDSAAKHLVAILDKKESPDRIGCGHPIPSDAMQMGIAHCPNCQAMINTDNLVGQLPFHGTTNDLAKFVARYFEVFKQNADIYCKFHQTDIRYKAQEKAKGLEVARRLRGLFIYPLNRILKDISNGASAEDRFRAFFNA